MPGRTYHINYHGNGSATIECAYLYPYCNQDTTASIEINADVTEQAEQGVFFDPVHCDLSGKVTDLRFWQGNTI